MNAYVIPIIAAGLMLLIAAVISNSIAFEGGVNPKDPRKRKIVFWILALINPVVAYAACLMLAPASSQVIAHNDYMSGLPIGTGIGFVPYIVVGFVVAKAFKTGKLGNWF